MFLDKIRKNNLTVGYLFLARLSPQKGINNKLLFDFLFQETFTHRDFQIKVPCISKRTIIMTFSF